MRNLVLLSGWASRRSASVCQCRLSYRLSSSLCSEYCLRRYDCSYAQRRDARRRVDWRRDTQHRSASVVWRPVARLHFVKNSVSMPIRWASRRSASVFQCRVVWRLDVWFGWVRQGQVWFDKVRLVQVGSDFVILGQCCATFLHSRHTKYCRRVMAAHQPHSAYCGGEGDGLWHLLAATTSYKSTPTEKCSIWC
jgi:hypothetical protein